MKWAAVIGSPIDHSRSPILHRAAWENLGLGQDWEYRRIECTEDQVPSLLTRVDANCLGLSVTMPCKHAVMAHLDAIDPLAVAVESVNTVISAGGVLTGFNTDVHGIQAALEGATSRHGVASAPTSAVILGSGATASSALAAVGSMGVRDITVIARRFSGPHSILMAAMRLGLTINQVPWADLDGVVATINAADLVVSTVPSGVADVWATEVTPHEDQILLDVVYQPLHTALVEAWRVAGAPVAHGLDMLVHQAAAQVRLMTGRDVDPEVMRAAVVAELGEYRV